MFFLLKYFMVPNFEAARKKYRNEHLQHIKRYSDSGKLLLGGACGTPISEGLIVFYVDDKQAVQDFAESDIYVKSGIVTRYSINEWHLVIGNNLLENEINRCMNEV